MLPTLKRFSVASYRLAFSIEGEEVVEITLPFDHFGYEHVQAEVYHAHGIVLAPMTQDAWAEMLQDFVSIALRDGNDEALQPLAAVHRHAIREQ